jgi:phospholipid/cholesterol/gamma-HCH transport system ATP-binding protein
VSDAFAIRLEHVWTRFGDKIVHKDINLALPHSEILGLVGASGCGKTVLLREIIGLQTPSQGKIFVMGEAMNTETDANSHSRKHQCGVLFQKGALFSVLNVFENIAFPLRELGIDDEEFIRCLVFMKLENVGLSIKDAWLKPSALSGGMIKRVALARTLILEPRLLLLDEPTSGLDPISSQDFVDLLSGLHRDLKFTVVLVTHDLDILRDLCTKVAVLADQQLVAFGNLSEVMAHQHPFVQRFFHNQRARRVFDYQADQVHG